ncbi:hypothetical protein V6N11_045984 [Hibiscus sabdariffa]|uniref:Dirigent protein n=1 Tax=Hibiscus sabdariffa TaxID=183260 RepID=A0ABR2Q2L9_9ROSI
MKVMPKISIETIDYTTMKNPRGSARALGFLQDVSSTNEDMRRVVGRGLGFLTVQRSKDTIGSASRLEARATTMQYVAETQCSFDTTNVIACTFTLFRTQGLVHYFIYV